MTSESVPAELLSNVQKQTLPSWRNRSENRLVSFNGFGSRDCRQKAHFSWKNKQWMSILLQWMAQNLLILLAFCRYVFPWNPEIRARTLASRAIERYSPCEFKCIWPTMSICDNMRSRESEYQMVTNLSKKFASAICVPLFWSRVVLLEFTKLAAVWLFWLAQFTTGMSCLGQDPVGQNCSRVKVKRRYFPHRAFEIQ